MSSSATSATFDLIGIGSPIMDLTAPVPESFLAHVRGDKGGMVLVDAAEMDAIIARLPSPPSLENGGSAANVVRNAAGLGLRTTFLGKQGHDTTAAAYRERAAAAGVDVSRFKTATLPHARCLALITPDAARTMRTDLGAALTLSPAELSAADFAGVRHAHIEGYLVFNPALADAVLAHARASGATVSVDIASFEVVNASREWLFTQFRQGGIGIVFANEDEIRALYPNSGDDYAALAVRLAAEGVIAVVKVGKEGAWIAHGTELHRIAPVAAPQVVDTNGAGDAFAGAFLHAHLNGWSLPAAGALAALVGSECVRHSGPAIPAHRWPELRATAKSLDPSS
jgi:sugar/nucleoside kinase (ribokinase family)